ncbi:hypothetical protein RxyAA322_30380 [Rubrobacter xylanophilus]|uniref:NlpC/P60 domain-containing protein n=1 Tax=Rubrobacter xylanophilus TaxID=49319 RepID=A0A510HMN3_9ACTN|nr:NlpC/P60 family protein [Rubrobacter xylanophilus]BBL81184.1 hypothetical protein RxyAA322_30380 [Rubrobacter xylanophilus]
MFRSRLILAALSLAAALLGLGLSGRAASAEPYSQVVDNATRGRFEAPGWGTSSWNDGRYGKDYRYARPARKAKPARYRVRIPATGYYTVYARWPADRGYNAGTRIGVSTVDGLRWVRVNQQRNGDRWNRLGVFRMKAGDRFYIRISRRAKGGKYVIADAVKVVRGKVGGGAGGAGITGYHILKEARTWLGVPYRYGGESREGVDCSGLTMKVYEKFGIKLPRTAHDQYHSGPGRKVSRDALRRGYLVFGHADGGSGIEHVGILTGDGRMIHAPAPGTVVRYDSVPAGWYNIVGVKRIVPPR